MEGIWNAGGSGAGVKAHEAMTPAQAKRAYKILTEVQMMLGDLPKTKALKAYNKISKVKFHIKKAMK